MKTDCTMMIVKTTPLWAVLFLYYPIPDAAWAQSPETVPQTATENVPGTNTPPANTAIPEKIGKPLDWTTENDYWIHNYASRPYYTSTRTYSAYEPAYRYGVDTYVKNIGRAYNQLDQEELRKGWEAARANSGLTWDEAQSATRDAYERMYLNSGAGTSSPLN